MPVVDVIEVVDQSHDNLLVHFRKNLPFLAATLSVDHLHPDKRDFVLGVSCSTTIDCLYVSCLVSSNRCTFPHFLNGATVMTSCP